MRVSVTPIGLWANASKCSHAELDASPDLDVGNPLELAREYRVLRQLLPRLNILGGCCGTDHRHVETICAVSGGRVVRGLTEPAPVRKLIVELQLQKLWSNVALIAVEDGHTTRQREALFAGITGIEKQHAADRFAERLVRVAEHDGVRTFGNKPVFQVIRQRPRVNDVMHQKVPSPQVHSFGQVERQPGVGVAEHGCYRRNRFEREQQRVRADIARVENVINAGEELRDPGIKESVSVGDDADLHGGVMRDA